MTKAASGKFPTGSYIGTLANGGTGLAPFHDFDSKVPADLKSQLAQVKAGHHGRHDQDHFAEPADGLTRA